MNVAIYARVSTQRQAQSQSIDQQLDRLRTHCRGQGWTPSQDAIFRDDGYSGASLNRPGLDQLRDRIKSDEIERVLITAPDRLGRKYARQAIIISVRHTTGQATAVAHAPDRETRLQPISYAGCGLASSDPGTGDCQP